MLVVMPGSDQDITPVDITPEDDTGRSAADEFTDAATAVTKNRMLPDQVRRALASRDNVRKSTSPQTATEDVEPDGEPDGDECDQPSQPEPDDHEQRAPER